MTLQCALNLPCLVRSLMVVFSFPLFIGLSEVALLQLSLGLHVSYSFSPSVGMSLLELPDDGFAPDNKARVKVSIVVLFFANSSASSFPLMPMCSRTQARLTLFLPRFSHSCILAHISFKSVLGFKKPLVIWEMFDSLNLCLKNHGKNTGARMAMRFSFDL